MLEYWRKGMIIGEKILIFKDWQGDLTLFWTAIGNYTETRVKKVAHFTLFGEPWGHIYVYFHC